MPESSSTRSLRRSRPRVKRSSTSQTGAWRLSLKCSLSMDAFLLAEEVVPDTFDRVAVAFALDLGGRGAGAGDAGLVEQSLVLATHAQQLGVLRLGLQAPLDHRQRPGEIAAPVGAAGQLAVAQGHPVEPGQGFGVVRRPAK